jgi:hypothetical protein
MLLSFGSGYSPPQLTSLTFKLYKANLSAVIFRCPYDPFDIAVIDSSAVAECVDQAWQTNSASLPDHVQAELLVQFDHRH